MYKFENERINLRIFLKRYTFNLLFSPLFIVIII
jgi:hypothetical protein